MTSIDVQTDLAESGSDGCFTTESNVIESKQIDGKRGLAVRKWVRIDRDREWFGLNDAN